MEKPWANVHRRKWKQRANKKGINQLSFSFSLCLFSCHLFLLYYIMNTHTLRSHDTSSSHGRHHLLQVPQVEKGGQLKVSWNRLLHSPFCVWGRLYFFFLIFSFLFFSFSFCPNNKRKWVTLWLFTNPGSKLKYEFLICLSNWWQRVSIDQINPQTRMNSFQFLSLSKSKLRLGTEIWKYDHVLTIFILKTTKTFMILFRKKGFVEQVKSNKTMRNFVLKRRERTRR